MYYNRPAKQLALLGDSFNKMKEAENEDLKCGSDKKFQKKEIFLLN